MDAKFWHQRWAGNQIAFHQSEANRLLANHFGELSLAEGSRIFLPLCGKTLDIAWLLKCGHRVVGNELSEIAIEQLFANLAVEPEISQVGELKRWSASNIDIFVGDFFELSRELLGPVDATYDRAALVALPEEMRGRYAAHLVEITNSAPQFLLCFEYDQDQMDGPPFSVGNDEVARHYGDRYQLSLIARVDVPGKLKGICVADEIAWLLQV